MNFCSHCGATVNFRVPPGDRLPRHCCDQCGRIHYENPRMVVGAIPVWGDRILLCRRAIEPRHGFWTLPAGFMENNETTGQAAIRETLEEACARIKLEGMYAVFNVPHINQVHILFRARLLDLEFAPGEETLELDLFREEDVPWERIAFRSISFGLKHYFEDRRTGAFLLHLSDDALDVSA